ncbi:MAG: SDR family oxidoreductase [Rhizomicrobium sp.]|jgi:3-oxoacyl-[acyl-carrier protein] reductase
MDLQLGGKHIFIAGASRGIGRAMAEAFLREGANVSLTARSAGPLDETHADFAKRHGAARLYKHAGNMTATATIAAALAGAEAALGPIHTLVANVGLDDAPMGFDVSDEKWDSGLAQNFLGSMRLAREALKRVKTRPQDERAGFNIIFISSIAGLEALGTPLTYGASKAALNHASQELAKTMGREGIRVNTIAPGNIIFPGGDWEKRVAERPDDWNRWVRREVALKRFGKPEEIADAALFLASPRASFVTGVVWPVDGGQMRR